MEKQNVFIFFLRIIHKFHDCMKESLRLLLFFLKLLKKHIAKKLFPIFSGFNEMILKTLQNPRPLHSSILPTSFVWYHST